MSIRDEARQEAERRYPIRLPYNRDFEIRDREQKAFEAGAVWASEQAEAIDRMGPAAGCAYCVGAGGYEDYDGEWRECSCQRANRKPSDDEVEAAGRGLYENRVSLIEGEANRSSWPTWEGLEKTDADEWRDAGRAALIAAQEVRNRG